MKSGLANFIAPSSALHAPRVCATALKSRNSGIKIHVVAFGCFIAKWPIGVPAIFERTRFQRPSFQGEGLLFLLGYWNDCCLPQEPKLL